MRVPKGQRTKAVVSSVAVVLVLGGIVGTTSLDGGDGTAESTASRPATGESFSSRAGGGAGVGAPQSVEATSGSSSGAVMAGGGGDSDSAATNGPVDVYGARTPEDLGGEDVPAGVSNVIKEADLELDLGENDLDAAQARARSLVRSAGGFIESSQLSDGTATMTFRVPAGDFEEVLAEMRDLGEVTSENITGEDVSAEVVDLEARLRHWQAQEAAFLELMERTSSISETIEIRRELGTIQQQIEQIQARMRFLEDRTSFSTLTVTLVTPAAGAAPVEEEGAGTLSEAWDQAWGAALSVVGGTLIVLGALVPLSVIVGIPGLVLWSVLRRRRGGTAPAPAA